MRKWIKWIGIVCLIPIVLVLLISILLYIPPIQNFVLQKATRYASEATGMQIHVDRIHLSFPLDLTVNGVEVLTSSQDTLPVDTLVSLQKLHIRVNPIPLIHKVASVNALDMEGVRINTGSFIEGIEIKGAVNSLSARADYIDLASEKATLNNLDLSNAAITLQIYPTEKEDTTTSTPLNWILALEKINLNQVCFAMQMPADSLRLSTYIDEAGLKDGLVDLGLSRYTVDQFTIGESTLNYEGDNKEPVAGLDPMHIALSQLNIDVRSIVYQDKEINADIREFSTQERSGLTVTSLEGKIHSDSITIEVPELTLKTPSSELQLLATIPWSILEKKSEGNLHAMLTAAIGKDDVMAFATTLPRDFQRAYPNRPINLTAGIEGNLDALTLQQLKAELPTAFSFTAAGKLGSLMDSINRSANIKLQARTQRMDFALAFLPAAQREQFHIPNGMRLSGDVILKNQALQTKLLLTEDKAKIQLAGGYHMVHESYKASLAIDSLEPIHFMPNDSLLWVTAAVQAEGKGFDFFSPATWSELDGKLSDIQYGSMAIEDITFSGSLKENQVSFDLNSKYPTAQMDITLNGTLQREDIKAMLIMDVDSLDLYALHLMEKPFSTSFSLFGEAESDLKKDHKIDLSIGNWDMYMSDVRFSPRILTLQARTDEDTTRVSLHSGDLGLVLTGNADLETMMDKFTTISNEVSHQLAQDSTVNIAALRPVLPDMDLQVRAGTDNPIYNILRQNYLSYSSIYVDASTSPENGLRMDAGFYGLRQDTLQIDTIQATIRPDSAGLLFTADVIKNKYRQQTPFTAHVKGSVKYRYADAELLYTNHKDEIGLLIGVKAQQEPDGFNFQLYPEQVVLAFNSFSLNPDNYIKFRSTQDIEADVRLTGKNNASLWIHSIPGAGTFPEIHAELSQIDLNVVSQGFAELPKMRGILSADLQYAPEDSTFMVVADVNIDNLIYENGRVGEIMLNAVYLPLANSEHQVDVHLYRDREEITTATAMYMAGKTDNNISGNLDIITLPLEMVSPFIPDSMARMTGVLNGSMAIEGSTSAPVLNGYLQMDSSSVYVGMLDTRLRFDDKKIEVKNSLITFNDYKIYAAGDNPFVIAGNINMSNLSRMMADLRLNANNMQVLDAKRTNESLAYGQLAVNLSSTVKGPVNALMVRGDMDILGGTDATYVMRESALTVQDRLEGLVTFTSFTDTLFRQRRPQQQLPLGGIDMLMAIHIEPNVQLRVDLSPDQSNYVEVQGGGDLTFQYKPEGDMVLNGRYTFSEGIVNYTLPVVPLKEFHIHPDSYVQWDGEVMNPMINLAATERMRVSYQQAGQQMQRVNFDVGINIQNRLEDVELQFTLEAPDNGELQSELAGLGEDELSRRAIYLMATGQYLGSSSSGGLNMTSAINNFLMGEINNIAGDALKTVDISFGMDNYDSGELGLGSRTDFNFSFAKRFYNDRIRVAVGGKVSAGSEVDTETALDNVSMEYLLDAAGNRSVKLFHDRNYESLIEGEVVETGVGLVLRKKMLYLRELFNFRKKKVQPVSEDVPETEQQSNVEPDDEDTSDE